MAPPSSPSPHGLELVDDPGLLAENAGLTEWPVALLGRIEHALPRPAARGAADLDAREPEVLLAPRPRHRPHHRLHPRRQPRDRRRTAPPSSPATPASSPPASPTPSSSGRTTCAPRSPTMAAKLDHVTFHNKLGTQAERIARIAALAREIAPAVGADPDLAERAAQLAKADLASQMVYEFPELQGTMGRYYAERRRRGPRRRRRRRRALLAPRPLRRRPHRPALGRRRARRQARHAHWLLGHRRKTNRGSKDPFALRRAALAFSGLS